MERLETTGRLARMRFLCSATYSQQFPATRLRLRDAARFWVSGLKPKAVASTEGIRIENSPFPVNMKFFTCSGVSDALSEVWSAKKIRYELSCFSESSNAVLQFNVNLWSCKHTYMCS